MSRGMLVGWLVLLLAGLQLCRAVDPCPNSITTLKLPEDGARACRDGNCYGCSCALINAMLEEDPLVFEGLATDAARIQDRAIACASTFEADLGLGRDQLAFLDTCVDDLSQGALEAYGPGLLRLQTAITEQGGFNAFLRSITTSTRIVLAAVCGRCPVPVSAVAKDLSEHCGAGSSCEECTCQLVQVYEEGGQQLTGSVDNRLAEFTSCSLSRLSSLLNSGVDPALYISLPSCGAKALGAASEIPEGVAASHDACWARVRCPEGVGLPGDGLPPLCRDGGFDVEACRAELSALIKPGALLEDCVLSSAGKLLRAGMGADGVRAMLAE